MIQNDPPVGTRVRFVGDERLSDYLGVPYGTLGTVMPRLVQVGIEVLFDGCGGHAVWAHALELAHAERIPVH